MITQSASLSVGIALFSVVVIFYLTSFLWSNNSEKSKTSNYYDNYKSSKQKIKEINTKIDSVKGIINSFELDNDVSDPEIIVAGRIAYWLGQAVEDIEKLNILKKNKYY